MPTVQEENKEKGLSSSLLYHSLYAIREKQISRNPSDITALDSRTLQNLAVYEVTLRNQVGAVLQLERGGPGVCRRGQEGDNGCTVVIASLLTAVSSSILPVL